MRAGVVIALALLVAAPAAAQDLTNTAQEGAREQSCRALAAGTVGGTDQATGNVLQSPDAYPVEPDQGVPAVWPAAPAALKLPLAFPLRTTTETFNRRYAFATRGGQIYARSREDATSPWRQVPVPPCFAGRVLRISADDDELIALDDARRVYTLDNVLKGGLEWNWTSRWGTPFWAGPGYTLPATKAWAWSVISPAEDKTWTDPAGNHTPVGNSKVSHIWGLRPGGQRLTFWDPWLPLDDSYEMCGPENGRFRAVNLSASGSFVFLVGRHGDLFTRVYDFDLSGHDAVFFKYSYEDQRGKGDGAPIQLPAAPWVQQPKIPGTITATIGISKVGTGAVHRVLRVEGMRGGRTGYWQRDAAAPASAGWRFHATGLPLQRRPLDNPRRDTARVGLGPSGSRRFRHGADWIDYDVYCSPSRVHVGGRTMTLHHVDGLRQQPRARGLDDTPREQYAALDEGGGRFRTVTLTATGDEVRVDALGWVFRRAPR